MVERERSTWKEPAGLVMVVASLAFLGPEAGGGRFFPLAAMISGLFLLFFLILLPRLGTAHRAALAISTLGAFWFSCQWPAYSSLPALLALAWAGNALALPKKDGARDRLLIASTAVILIVMIRRILANSSVLWWGYEEISSQGTRLLSWLPGLELRAGPSASGLDLFIMFLVVAVSVASRRQPAPRGRRWWPVGFLFASWIVSLFLISTLVRFDLPRHFSLAQGHSHSLSGPSLIWFQAQGPIFLLIMGTATILGAQFLPPRLSLRRPGKYAPLMLALAGTIFLLFSREPVPSPGEATRRIFLLKNDSFDLQSPLPGLHPLNRAGMFGLLPTYLQAAGFIVDWAEKMPEGIDLDPYSILLVINPTRRFPPGQISEIREFVRRGGGLLVLGDHTDILGIQGPLNGLIKGYGIRFRFDSARPARPGWDWSLAWSDHPLTETIDPSNLLFRVGTGASLEVRPPARSLVRARFGFSDSGNRRNAGRGGFLGNYRWERDERIGDVCLLAEARLGRGKIVVSGDTSAFQNIALPFSFPFVARLFRWLSVPGPEAVLVFGRREMGAALLFFSAVWFLFRPCSPESLLAMGLLLALPQTMPAGKKNSDLRKWIQTSSQPLAVIDSGHLNKPCIYMMLEPGSHFSATRVLLQTG